MKAVVECDGERFPGITPWVSLGLNVRDAHWPVVYGNLGAEAMEMEGGFGQQTEQWCRSRFNKSV